MTNVHATEADRLRRLTWIPTASGGRFRPLAPNPADITIEDIAHALAHKCRYTGHTQRLYTVAEHSLLVSYATPTALALVGLLHDAAEAYLPDISAPLKPHLRLDDGRTFKELEAEIDAAIFEALGLGSLLPGLEDPAIKRADLAVLADEVGQGVARADGADWGLTVPPAGLKVQYMGPVMARALFKGRYALLREELGV